MKKLMTVFLAAALVFAFAGQASAALETKGEFRARYWNLSDYFQTLNPAAHDKVEFWDQRLRLYLTWPVSEGVKVQARADILEQLWGAEAANFHTTDFFSANTQIDFDWANAMVAIPGTPVTLTLGKQDVSWGPGVLAKADNRFRAKAAAKVANVNVSLAYDKNIETLHGGTLAGGVVNQDDADGVTLGVTTEVGGLNVGLLGVYTNDQTTSNLDRTRYGIDAFLTGKMAMADLKAEVAYYTGDNDGSNGVADQDVSGLLAYVGATIPAGPATIGAEFAYAQGDDPDTSENEGILRFDYQSPFWSVILFNNFDLPGWESFPGYFPAAGNNQDTSVNNAWAAKVSAAAKVMPKLTLYGAALYAARLEDTAAHASDPLGTELDLIAMYAVTENVNLNVGVGYLMAGDYYGDDIDDPFGATAQLVVNF